MRSAGNSAARSRKRLRFLEGQNARERDRKAQRDRLHRELPPAGVAMQHGAKRSLRHFVLEDAAAVLIGLAGVDDQRQAGGAGGGDMGAKAALLRFARAVLVEIVEPGFAQRHDLRMPGQLDQFVRRECRLPRRHDADGCRPSNRRSGNFSAIARSAPSRLTRVEIVTMRPMPAASARATMPSRSSAKSGKSRWQWLSTSIG